MSLTLRHAPRITRDKFAAILKAGTQAGSSPVAPIANECYAVITAAGLDPAIVLAIWAKETQYGVTGISPQTHNIGNVRKAFHPDWAIGQHPKGFAIYPDWFTGIRDLVDRLDKRYIDEWGLTTVEQIITKYAPPFENDTAGYIAFVNEHVNKWQQEDTGSMATTLWLPSENHNPRPAGAGIEIIVIHTGEGTRQSDMDALHDTDVPLEHRKSAHAYACRNGDLIEMVRDDQEAWHAGFSQWGGRVNVNPWSLGLESEHRTGQDWPDVQKQTMADWCKAKIEKYHIRQDMIAAHRWIAPTRKKDPSNWGDFELKAWIAKLYAAAVPPALRFYRVKTNANVRQGPGTDFPVALVMPMGEAAGFDTDKMGEIISGNGVWRHRADGLGFVFSGLLAPA